MDRVAAHVARCVPAARLGEEKWRDEIIRQVVEGRTRVQSLAEQITLARQALSTAEEVVRLTRERKQFAVGAVLEDIQAQQEFLRARLDHLHAVTEFNKAQSELQKNLGGSSGLSAGRVIQN